MNSELEDDAALFRREAILAARDRMGSPVKSPGVAGWVMAGFMLSILLAAIVFLCVAKYARRETVVGFLQPSAGAQRVSAFKPGMIGTVFVQDGQYVAAGQSLIVVSSDPTIANGRRLGEVLAEASDSQGKALARQIGAQRGTIARQREALKEKRAVLIGERERLSSEIVMQQERVRLAEETASAARTLWGQKLISALQFRQREEAMIAAKQALSAIERDQAALPASLAELSADESRLAAQEQENDALFVSNNAQLAEKRASTQSESGVVLTAQRSGYVTALQAKPGAIVGAGQALAVVLPPGAKLQAQLWLPSRAAGFVLPGDRVRLMYDAFPYQRFGVGRGRVLEVAGAPTAPTDIPEPLQATEALYRVVVELDDQVVWGYGKAWQLTPGMRLTADIVLEQQSLWAWLFDKVRAAQVRAQPI